MSKRDDLTGRSYGDLLVLRYDGYRKKRTYWVTRCKCGREAPVSSTSMKSGGVRSCLPCSGRKHAETTRNRAYLSHRTAGSARGRGFLSRAEWDSITQQKCHYCGKSEIRNSIRGVRSSNPRVKVSDEDCHMWDAEMVGVDRVDSSKPYTLANVVPCCKFCNQMKMDTPQDDFKAQILSVFNHWIKDAG